MTTILGIDAAWTATEASGVALIQRCGTRLRCVCVAPSYQSFIAAAGGTPVDWRSRPAASRPEPAALLRAARQLAATEVDIIAIDMPIATRPLTARRAAETEVSRRFGSRGCSTHSPLPDRPGRLGAQLTRGFVDRGYRIATTDDPECRSRRIVEVYPHVALLSLLNRSYRLPYKAGKSTRYWPALSRPQRVRKLLCRYRSIRDALSLEIGTLTLELPVDAAGTTLSALKRHEDALDALICCWMGSLYAAGRASPLGDATAAVWIPTSLLQPRAGC